MQLLGDRVDVKPERYAVDKRYPDIFYVPESAAFNVRDGAYPLDACGPAASSDPACGRRLHPSFRLQNPVGKGRAAARPGVWWDRVPMERSAINPVRSPAAASRRFPNRSRQ